MIKVWREGMADKEAKDLAYWERNMLALRYAEGWYNDDVDQAEGYVNPFTGESYIKPRYEGWRRVLSLEGGKITFHVPDDFDVGNLPQIERNWDGHSTEEKWKRVQRDRSIAA